jgi:hypothetical protein
MKIPYHVPPAYKVDSESYGQNGIVQALRYATEAKRRAESFARNAERTRVGTLAQEHYDGRRDHYRRLAIEWRACALSTALAARKRLSDERPTACAWSAWCASPSSAALRSSRSSSSR